MSEVSVECQREDIEYWNKQSLNVDYKNQEVPALQELKRFIIHGNISNINTIKSTIDQLIKKYGDDIIKTIILKWYCYCTNGKTSNVARCYQKIFETIDSYIDSKVNTRKRSNAVTKRAPNEQRIEKLKLNIQHIRNTLDEEIKNKSYRKRKPSPKREGQINNNNGSDEESDEESGEEFEDIVLRF